GGVFAGVAGIPGRYCGLCCLGLEPHFALGWCPFPPGAGAPLRLGLVPLSASGWCPFPPRAAQDALYRVDSSPSGTFSRLGSPTTRHSALSGAQGAGVQGQGGGPAERMGATAPPYAMVTVTRTVTDRSALPGSTGAGVAAAAEAPAAAKVCTGDEPLVP